MVRAVEELPLAQEVMGNADGAIPDSIGQEKNSLDNGGGSQNEGLQGNPYVPEHGGICPHKTPLMHLLLKMDE